MGPAQLRQRATRARAARGRQNEAETDGNIRAGWSFVRGTGCYTFVKNVFAGWEEFAGLCRKPGQHQASGRFFSGLPAVAQARIGWTARFVDVFLTRSCKRRTRNRRSPTRYAHSAKDVAPACQWGMAVLLLRFFQHRSHYCRLCCITGNYQSGT